MFIYDEDIDVTDIITDSVCVKDDELRNPVTIEACPLGKEVCDITCEHFV